SIRSRGLLTAMESSSPLERVRWEGEVHQEGLEVVARAEWVEIGIVAHVGDVVEAGGDGPPQGGHRSIGRGEAPRRVAGAGVFPGAEQGLDAGQVVEQSGVRVGDLCQDLLGPAEKDLRLGGLAEREV